MRDAGLVQAAPLHELCNWMALHYLPQGNPAMTAEPDLLPLPAPDYLLPLGPGHGAISMWSENTIRQIVAHATAAKDAEVEALRAEVDMLRGKVDEAVVELLCRKARAERLAEALRLSLNSHGKTLLTDPPQDAWKVNRVEEIGRALLREQEEGHEQ